jgi:hypothetical protein
MSNKYTNPKGTRFFFGKGESAVRRTPEPPILSSMQRIFDLATGFDLMCQCHRPLYRFEVPHTLSLYSVADELVREARLLKIRVSG